MRLAIYAIGRLKTGPEKEMFDRYASLAANTATSLGASVPPIREIAESRHADAKGRQSAETGQLRKSTAKGAFIVVLDEKGREITSRELAELIEKKMREGVPEIAFLIGGPDGHDPDIRNISGLVLRFGSMTWPHRLARIMLAEQIYRALTILSGHPYHRQ